MRSFLTAAGAAPGQWHLFRKSQTRKCQNPPAVFAWAFRLTGLWRRWCPSASSHWCQKAISLGLRPPEVVTLGRRHEKSWRHTDRKSCLSPPENWSLCSKSLATFSYVLGHLKPSDRLQLVVLSFVLWSGAGFLTHWKCDLDVVLLQWKRNVVAGIVMTLIFNLSVCEKLEEREAEGPTQQWINTKRDRMLDTRKESDPWQ